MIWPFKKKAPKPDPVPVYAREHREALAYFLRNQTSVGCYGGAERLDAALEAMRFFAHTNDFLAGQELHELRGSNARLVRLNELMMREKVAIVEVKNGE